MNTQLNWIARIENGIAEVACARMRLQGRIALIVRQAERGDADSAGSTLRTVFVVGVVALVLTTLGPGIVQAAADALATLTGTRP
jgi:hypothetical protein